MSESKDLFTVPIIQKIPVRIRWGSMLVDHVIICFLCLPIIFLVQFVIYPDFRNSAISEYIMLPVFVIYFCKDCIHGRSIAKRILKLSIVNYSSNVEASPFQSVVRNFSIIIWPIEVLVSYFNPERRIGDRLANTKLTYSYNPNVIGRKIKVWELVGATSVATLFSIFLLLSFSLMY